MATVRLFSHHIYSSYYWLALVDALVCVLAFYLGAYIYFFSEPGSINQHLGQIPLRATLFSLITVISLILRSILLKFFLLVSNIH